jgi:hypothetical protein
VPITRSGLDRNDAVGRVWQFNRRWAAAAT